MATFLPAGAGRMGRVRSTLVTAIACAALAATGAKAGEPMATDASPRFPGPTDEGFLLPNGWHLSPAGRHVETGDLVLNIRPLADGRRALVTTDGFNAHRIQLIDLEKGAELAAETAHQSWFGLAIAADESRVWWSGGGTGGIHAYRLEEDGFSLQSQREADPLRSSPQELGAAAAKLAAERRFKSGLERDDDAGLLWSADINRGRVVATRDDGSESGAVDTGGRPYDIRRSPRNGLIYVSDWAGARLLVVDPAAMRVVARIPVGEHPNQIAFHPTDDRLFVACASSDGVWVIDTRRGVVTETIRTSLFPKAPEGSTPDALAAAPDGKTLYVANADNNCLAVIDVAEPGESQVKGFIPTGWYPTAVAVTSDGGKILVGIGKGNRSEPNPLYDGTEDDDELTDLEKYVRKLMPHPYIGTIVHGAVSIVEVPDDERLAEYTATVYRNCPYSDDLLEAVPFEGESIIPRRVGDPCPIEYVIYVIKENRTYDQVFGDMAAGDAPKGNGDPSLCMFPRAVTPNHHALAERFVLFDNAYCNGQVSRDGHPWSTMAYATDYVARDWHLTYSQRVGVEDDDKGDLSNAPSGYLWDACRRAGVSYRSYKEFGGRVSDAAGNVRIEGRVPGLVGHMCPDYGTGEEGEERDTDLVEVFLREYREFVAKGTMPRFIVMSLGEDHTHGTTPGAPTPRACVASNDLALGRLVDAVSHGPLWEKTAIFVIEDDAQNGPDHVDAHRTVCLVASPWAKRGAIDSTQYSTVSLIRTMELILGLEPLSQYDAAARPMFEAFGTTPDPEPFVHQPARVDLDERNGPGAYGAARSAAMDFSEYDRIDDFELNEILWHAVMGTDAPEPPAVRRAIVLRQAAPRP